MHPLEMNGVHSCESKVIPGRGLSGIGTIVVAFPGAGIGFVVMSRRLACDPAWRSATRYTLAVKPQAQRTATADICVLRIESTAFRAGLRQGLPASHRDSRRGAVMRIVAIVLLVAGVLGLGCGGFSYTRQTHDATLGPLEILVSETQRVNVPCGPE